MIGGDEYGELPGEVAAAPKRSVAPWVLLTLVVLGGAAGGLWLRWKLQQASGYSADLEKRLEKSEAEKADLLALKNQLSAQVQSKDEEITKLQGTYQELETKMKEEIAQGDVRLSQAGGRIKVDLVDKILFDVGDASITKRGEEVLSRVGAVLANVQDKKIQVSGHTDDQPIHERLRDRYPTNWELASSRAINVVRYLEEKAHVPGKLLVAAAYGPWEPISSNRTTSGRARNRRIEIVLAPALAPEAAPGAKTGDQAIAKPTGKLEAGPEVASAKPVAEKPAHSKVAAAKKKARRK